MGEPRRGRTSVQDAAVSRAFIYGLGAAVGLVWTVSVMVSIFKPAYQTPLAVHGLMGSVVGSVFADVGLQRARRRRGEDDE